MRAWPTDALERRGTTISSTCAVNADAKGKETCDRPKVTVIVPAFNMEAYIERSLYCAVNQTYPNLEILVIDDGSTDRTLQIAQRFARGRANIRVLTGANSGVAAARNLGIQLADSLYVAFLDADDLWGPTKIERQVAALATHGHSEDWAGCYTLYRMIDENDAVIGDGPFTRQTGAFFEEHLQWNHVGNGSSLLVRRDAALAVGGFNPDYARNGIGGCEDLEFQLKLLRERKFEVVPEYEVGYRIHREQMSRNLPRMRLSRVAVVENIAVACALPDKWRKRLLAEAYLMTAQAFRTVGDRRGALRWATAAFASSPSATLARIKSRLGRNFRYWWRSIAQPAPEASAPQSFCDVDPDEGVRPDRATEWVDFGPLLNATRSRFDLDHPGVTEPDETGAEH